MAGLGPTPLDFTSLFSRAEFLRGGPNGLSGATTLRVYGPRQRLPLYSFDSMLVTNISTIDAERVSYFLKANGRFSLYAFGRAIQAFRVQCILIDAATRDEIADALFDGDLINEEVAGARSRQAYEQFMALYEQELRISAAIRKKRKVQLEVRGYNYTGFVCSEKSGYASDADWMCITNFEFLALRAEIIPVPQSRLAIENTPQASTRGLVENTPGVRAAQEGIGNL